MRKVKFVKIVVPEIVAYFGNGNDSAVPEYRCSECGYGVADDYTHCPHCGSELDWKRVKRPSQKFIEFLDRL